MYISFIIINVCAKIIQLTVRTTQTYTLQCLSLSSGGSASAAGAQPQFDVACLCASNHPLTCRKRYTALNQESTVKIGDPMPLGTGFKIE
jgi:hypothetical protein